MCEDKIDYSDVRLLGLASYVNIIYLDSNLHELDLLENDLISMSLDGLPTDVNLENLIFFLKQNNTVEGLIYCKNYLDNLIDEKRLKKLIKLFKASKESDVSSRIDFLENKMTANYLFELLGWIYLSVSVHSKKLQDTPTLLLEEIRRGNHTLADKNRLGELFKQCLSEIEIKLDSVGSLFKFLLDFSKNF
jgi:hypothetical protein